MAARCPSRDRPTALWPDFRCQSLPRHRTVRRDCGRTIRASIRSRRPCPRCGDPPVWSRRIFTRWAPGSMRPAPTKSLFPARVILWVYVVELYGRHAVDLNYSIADAHRIMVHVGVEISEAARWEGHHLALIELITHSHFEGTRNHGNVLVLRVPMGSDFVAIGHLDADCEIT